MSRTTCTNCHRTFVVSSSSYCPFCGHTLRRDAVDDVDTVADAILDLGTAYLVGSALDSLVNSVSNDTSSDSFSVGSDWSGGGGDSGGGGSSGDW